jgi:hypothetical protein
MPASLPRGGLGCCAQMGFLPVKHEINAVKKGRDNMHS